MVREEVRRVDVMNQNGIMEAVARALCEAGVRLEEIKRAEWETELPDCHRCKVFFDVPGEKLLTLLTEIKSTFGEIHDKRKREQIKNEIYKSNIVVKVSEDSTNESVKSEIIEKLGEAVQKKKEDLIDSWPEVLETWLFSSS